MNSFPTSLKDLEEWARSSSTTLQEANTRFVQFVVIESLANGPMKDILVFKGGNALRFCHHGQRSTIDLDFTAQSGLPDDVEYFRLVIDKSVRLFGSRHGIAMKVQKCVRNPKRSDADLPTYQINVGYRFPGDRKFNTFLGTKLDQSPFVVQVEVSLNDVICESERIDFGIPQSHVLLSVCTLEDIIAEKLRAILQQSVRNRFRPQDVFDIATFYSNGRDDLDRVKIRQFFVEKSSARGIFPTRDSFDNLDLVERSQYGYAELEKGLGPLFIPHEAAWRIVLELVDAIFEPNDG